MFYLLMVNIPPDKLSIGSGETRDVEWAVDF